MARANKTQYAILGCLLIKPMTPYEIKQFLSQYTQHFWTEGEGQIYPTFKQLVDEGLAIFKEEDAQKIGKKKIYSITPEGEAYFSQWFGSQTETTTERNPTLLKVFFGRTQPIGKTIDILNQSLSQIKDKHAVLLGLKMMLHQKLNAGINTTFYQMTLDYGVLMVEAEIEWHEQALALLKKGTEL